MSLMPVLFVSHGSPTVVIEDLPLAHFLKGIAADLPKPKAILCVSAHWGTTAPELLGVAHPGTIHDFGGFPEELYTLHYPAPGAPELAAEIVETIGGTVLDRGHGFDHGVWNPLMLMYPEADIPVIAASVAPNLNAISHFKWGQKLAYLREQGVLIMGSGGTVHNIPDALLHYRTDGPMAKTPDWTLAFDTWINRVLTEGSMDDLMQWTKKAPHALKAHPTPEHLMPLMVTAGAAGGEPALRVHHSTQWGSLVTSCYRWG